MRQIEKGEYSAAEFISQLKEMISEIVLSVLKDNSNRRIIAEQQDTTGVNKVDNGDNKKEGSGKSKKSSNKSKSQ